MSDLLLSKQERERFASWLEHEALVGRDLIVYMEKLGPAGAMLASRERAEAKAAELIARKLRATHTQSI